MQDIDLLKSIDFGKLAAENDDLLGKYFVKTEAYRKVISGERWFLLGNRGSGKTAIFKGLESHASKAGGKIIQLKPEEYSYELASSSLAKEVDGNWQKGGAYTVAWKWLVIKLTLETLADSTAGARRKDAGKIHAFLRDNYGAMKLSPIDQMIQFMKTIESIKLGKLGEVGIGRKSLPEIFKLDEFAPILPSMRACLSRTPVHVIIDELDRGWDGSEDAQNFVAGLFRAAVNLNSEFDGLRVYVSLRQELYESIPALFEDTQKHRDVVENVRWDEAKLKNLIARRIVSSLDLPNEVDDDAAWSMVFGEVLSYRNTRPFSYIIDRTTKRPRELISFCGTIRDRAIEHGMPVDYDIIVDAERQYSKDRFDDISSEYRFQYPGLTHVMDSFRGRVYKLDREELEELCLHISTSEMIVKSAPWVELMEPDRLISILWEVGFILALNKGGQKGGARSGSQYVGIYDRTIVSVDRMNTFKIHPMLHSYLGLREKGGKKSDGTEVLF